MWDYNQPNISFRLQVSTIHQRSHKMVEILACKWAVQVAMEINILKIHVEMDSKAVINMLNDPMKNLSAVGSWVEEIKWLLHTFKESKVTWVRRTTNVATHKLAKIGVGEELCKVWFSVPPDFILDVVSDEILEFW